MENCQFRQFRTKNHFQLLIKKAMPDSGFDFQKFIEILKKDHFS